MSRSGYSDDIDDNWSWVMWRGAVASAMRGRKGQDFLRELLAAMDALPEKRLVDSALEREGDFCALGAVGRRRAMPLERIDPEDQDGVAGAFGIARAMACEIMYMNDEAGWRNETPEDRFLRMRKWVESEIKADAHD